MKFVVNFFTIGNQKISKTKVITTSVLLSILVFGVHSCTNIEKSKIWGVIDEFQRAFQGKGLAPSVNEVIIKDPKLLKQRIERDVDKAIREYNQKTEGQSSEPHSILKNAILYQCNPDNSEAQVLLGGPIGIHSPWYIPKDCK